MSLGDAAPIVNIDGGRVREDDIEHGQSGHLVRALYEQFSSRPAPSHPIGIAMDPEIPYRTMFDIVYTLGRARCTELALLVRRGPAIGSLPLTFPELGSRIADPSATNALEQMLLGQLEGDDAFEDALTDGHSPADSEDVDGEPASSRTAPVELGPEPTTEVELGLNVTVTIEGFIVAASGGRLAPGCERTHSGRAVTVPVRDGAQDSAELTRCLERVHREDPREDS